MQHGTKTWVAASLLFWLGPPALAAAPTPGATPQFNPYALPTIYPNYPPDSPFRSLVPGYPAPGTAKVAPPVPDTSAPARINLPPIKDSLYKSGQPVLNNNQGSGGSGFSSNQAPIVDPDSVPKELTFEPRKSASPGPSSTPAPVPAPTDSQEP